MVIPRLGICATLPKKAAVQARRIEDHISGLIHEKSVNVDLAFYETPDFYDHLHRARAEAGSRPIALLENAGNLVLWRAIETLKRTGTRMLDLGGI